MWSEPFISEETDVASSLKISNVILVISSFMKSLLRDEIFLFILWSLVFVFIYINIFTYLFYEEIKALMNLEF